MTSAPNSSTTAPPTTATTASPSARLISATTNEPTTKPPTKSPTKKPTASPTKTPTDPPTKRPTNAPTYPIIEVDNCFRPKPGSVIDIKPKQEGSFQRFSTLCLELYDSFILRIEADYKRTIPTSQYRRILISKHEIQLNHVMDHFTGRLLPCEKICEYLDKNCECVKPSHVYQDKKRLIFNFFELNPDNVYCENKKCHFHILSDIPDNIDRLQIIPFIGYTNYGLQHFKQVTEIINENGFEEKVYLNDQNIKYKTFPNMMTTALFINNATYFYGRPNRRIGVRLRIAQDQPNNKKPKHMDINLRLTAIPLSMYDNDYTKSIHSKSCHITQHDKNLWKGCHMILNQTMDYNVIIQNQGKYATEWVVQPYIKTINHHSEEAGTVIGVVMIIFGVLVGIGLLLFCAKKNYKLLKKCCDKSKRGIQERFETTAQFYQFDNEMDINDNHL